MCPFIGREALISRASAFSAPFGPSDSAPPRQMPTDASGKGSADAASAAASNRLTKTQLDAILSLAAAGDVEPKEETTHPDARGVATPVHIAIWDAVNEVKRSGADAPTTETLADFLKSHPNCEVFAGQRPSGRAATERSGLDKLLDASEPPSSPTLGDKHLTLREHAALSQGGEEPTKRSMYTPEQLQRLQVREAASPRLARASRCAPAMLLIHPRANGRRRHRVRPLPEISASPPWQEEFEACELPNKEQREVPARVRVRAWVRVGVRSDPIRGSARYQLGFTLLHPAAPCCTLLHPAAPCCALLYSTLHHPAGHASRLATLAQALAAELDIPTRSVQIWFQNRRQRVKSASSGPKRAGTDTRPNPSPSPSPSLSPDPHPNPDPDPDPNQNQNQNQNSIPDPDQARRRTAPRATRTRTRRRRR